MNPHSFTHHYYFFKKIITSLIFIPYPTPTSFSHPTIPPFHFHSLTQSYSSFHCSFLLYVFLNSSSLVFLCTPSLNLSLLRLSPFPPILPFTPNPPLRSPHSLEFLFLNLNPRPPPSYQEHPSWRLKSLELNWISFLFLFSFLLWVIFPSCYRVFDGAIRSRSTSLYNSSIQRISLQWYWNKLYCIDALFS